MTGAEGSVVAMRLRALGWWGLIVSGTIQLFTMALVVLGLFFAPFATLRFEFVWVAIGVIACVVASALLVVLSHSVGRALGALSLVFVAGLAAFTSVVQSDSAIGLGFASPAAVVAAFWIAPLVNVTIGVAALVVGTRCIRQRSDDRRVHV